MVRLVKNLQFASKLQIIRVYMLNSENLGCYGPNRIFLTASISSLAADVNRQLDYFLIFVNLQQTLKINSQKCQAHNSFNMLILMLKFLRLPVHSFFGQYVQFCLSRSLLIFSFTIQVGWYSKLQLGDYFSQQNFKRFCSRSDTEVF